MEQKSISYGEICELQQAFETRYKNSVGDKYEEALSDYITTYINAPQFTSVEQYAHSDYWQPCR